MSSSRSSATGCGRWPSRSPVSVSRRLTHLERGELGQWMEGQQQFVRLLGDRSLPQFQLIAHVNRASRAVLDGEFDDAEDLARTMGRHGDLAGALTRGVLGSDHADQPSPPGSRRRTARRARAHRPPRRRRLRVPVLARRRPGPRRSPRRRSSQPRCPPLGRISTSQGQHVGGGDGRARRGGRSRRRRRDRSTRARARSGRTPGTSPRPDPGSTGRSTKRSPRPRWPPATRRSPRSTPCARWPPADNEQLPSSSVGNSSSSPRRAGAPARR